MSTQNNRFKWMIFIIGLLVSFYLGYSTYYNNVESQKPINQVTEIKEAVTQDPDLVAKAAQLGIDVSRLNLTYKTNADPTIYAYFQPPNTIEVNPGQDPTKTLQFYAHEYYHYQWSQLTTPEERSSISPKLNNFYNQDAWLQKRMKFYDDRGCAGECFTDELDSIMCTEIPSYVISQEFIDYCNSVVPNRSLFIQ